MATFQSKRQSEDVLYVLSLLSSLTVILSSLVSLRYLGVLGVTLGAWRAYSIGQVQRKTDSLI